MSQHRDDTLRGDRSDPAVAQPTDAMARERAFDRAAQRCHAQALTALAPQTLSRLRAARHASSLAVPARTGLGWILAGGSAAVLALAIAVQWQRMPMDAAPPQQTAATMTDGDVLDAAVDRDDYPSLIASLDENPDLYLWLAANHDALPSPLER